MRILNPIPNSSPNSSMATKFEMSTEMETGKAKEALGINRKARHSIII
jgi:hypothetical protein